jgi:hypothetical protein
VKRILCSIAAATVAVLGTLVFATGTAAAATPAPAAAVVHLSGHHHHDWDDHDYWYDDDWTDHARDLGHADAQDILDDYFGDDYPSGPGPQSALICPDSPPPGNSHWACSRQPVG